MATQKARLLNSDEVREITSLTKEEITLDTLRGYFACFYGQDKPRFNTYDKFTLPPTGRFHNNSKIETTVGRYFVNLIAIPEAYHKKYGFVNEPLTKKAISAMEKKIGYMLLNDEITPKEYTEYLDYAEWIGMGVEYFLVPTMNYEINVPIPEVIQRRDELFEKYKNEISRGEPAIAEKIEKELLDMARKKIKESDNEAFDFFETGVGTFENHYKKTSIMAGAIENPYTKKLNILKSNYIDGINIHEYSNFSNLTLIGGYSRGVETQISGYQGKKVRNVMQTVVLDEDGSDCGTKYTLKITIPETLKELFLYRYVLENDGQLVLLTQNNIDKYVGREIRLRSPMYCKGEKICSKCAGELFYKIGIKNAGLVTDAMTGVLMNLSMKKFHDSTIRFNKIDVANYTKKR